MNNFSIKYLISLIFIFSTLTLSFMFGVLFFALHNKIIDFSKLEQGHNSAPTVLLDDEGNEWARFAADRRKPICINAVPQHLIQAFLAAEDHNFFNHYGISWRGIARSIIVNIAQGKRAQGASTITQQLVRLLFFDNKKTFIRKIKEQLYALLVELQFTKEQILETYLNNVYFGCGIYGVEAAAQRFWGKSAENVTIDEAATLASIMKAPNSYCPILHPEAAQARRNIILKSMRNLGMIDEQMYTISISIKVSVQKYSKDQRAPHLQETIRIFLEDLVGKEALYAGGLTVQTTLNKQAQNAATKAFQDHVAALRKGPLPGVDGAVVTIDAKNGGIKALVGGFNFNESQYNRATAKRQIGSTFKPILFAQALLKGKQFTDVYIDEPIIMKQQNGTLWEPKNFDKEFHGPMTLAHALSTSNNMISIKLLLELGVDAVVNFAQKFHIQGPFKPYPSLALGCVDATLKEVVGMFNVFACDGVYVEPHSIIWVKDRWGKKIWRRVPQQERILESTVANRVAKVLGLSFARRAATDPSVSLPSEVISKTGTTNDSRICWFTGSTPDYTTSVCIAYDDNRSMGKNVFPRKTAFPIWYNLHKQLPCRQAKFQYNPILKEIIINNYSGRVVRRADADTSTIFR